MLIQRTVNTNRVNPITESNSNFGSSLTKQQNPSSHIEVKRISRSISERFADVLAEAMTKMKDK